MQNGHTCSSGSPFDNTFASSVTASCQSQLNKQGLHGILWKGKRKDQSFPQSPGEPCKTLVLLQLEEDGVSICLSSSEYLR